MIYTLEYLNKDAELVVIRYNEADKTFNVVMPTISSVNYIEPTREQLFFCFETEEILETQGKKGSWSQKVGIISTENEETGETDAFVFIDSMMEDDGLGGLFDKLIQSHKNKEFEPKGADDETHS